MNGVRCKPGLTGLALPAPSPSTGGPGAGLIEDSDWIEVARVLRLSGRELQIVKGVFDDATEPAIAANLGCSSHTVHTHFERLHHKLGAHTRAQIILRVVQEVLARNGSVDRLERPEAGARLANRQTRQDQPGPFDDGTRPLPSRRLPG